MKKLSLLRHAKSDWHDPSQRDYDRPLNEKGRRVAQAMGQWIAAQKIAFDHVIASPAIRVEQTLEAFSKGYQKHFDITYDRKIYLASSATILDMVKEYSDEHDHIMVIGHNPGLEDIIFDLIPDDGTSPFRDIIEKKYPTGAYAQLSVNIESWLNIPNATANLEIFMPPRDINPKFGPDNL